MEFWKKHRGKQEQINLKEWLENNAVSLYRFRV